MHDILGIIYVFINVCEFVIVIVVDLFLKNDKIMIHKNKVYNTEFYDKRVFKFFKDLEIFCLTFSFDICNISAISELSFSSMNFR